MAIYENTSNNGLDNRISNYDINDKRTSNKIGSLYEYLFSTQNKPYSNTAKWVGLLSDKAGMRNSIAGYEVYKIVCQDQCLSYPQFRTLYQSGKYSSHKIDNTTAATKIKTRIEKAQNNGIKLEELLNEGTVPV